MRIGFRAGVLAAATVILSSCGGGGSGGSSPPPTPPAAPAGLMYSSPQSFVVAQAITALSPTVTGTVTSYAVAPQLPAGLSLNTTTGVISGTPTAITPVGTYIVTGSNAGGSSTANISITIT